MKPEPASSVTWVSAAGAVLLDTAQIAADEPASERRPVVLSPDATRTITFDDLAGDAERVEYRYGPVCVHALDPEGTWTIGDPAPWTYVSWTVAFSAGPFLPWSRCEIVASLPLGAVEGVKRYRIEVTASDGENEGAVFDLEAAVLPTADGPKLIGAPRSMTTFATDGACGWWAAIDLRDGCFEIWGASSGGAPVRWTARIEGGREARSCL